MEGLKFDNRALRELPVAGAAPTTATPSDGGGGRVSAAAGACYLLAPPPTPLPGLRLLLHSPSALELLGLDPADVERRPHLYASALLGGGETRDGGGSSSAADAAAAPSPSSRLAPGAQPAAHVYAGHQHAYFAGLLGDGAALYLGEVVGNHHHHRRLELNLEGAGPTPLSRPRQGGTAAATATAGAAAATAPPVGRKTLLQAAREMLASEALAALGVPATRAAMLGYCPETRCATVLRLAPSFLRVGSLEICRPAQAGAAAPRAGPSAAAPGPWEVLPRLVDHAIRRHYPEVWSAFGGGGGGSGDESAAEEAAGGSSSSSPASSSFHLASDLEARGEMVAALLGELSASLGRTCALWMAQGFVHGSLNTDNLSLGGQTLNAGARGAFLGRADRSFSANPLDDAGRYSFGSQPSAVRFALERLAEALGSASALAAAGITTTAPGAGAAATGAAVGGEDGRDAAIAAASTSSSLAMPGGVGPGRARRELARFDAEYEAAYLAAMRRKLGLLLLLSAAASGVEGGASPGVEASSAADDRSLVEALLTVMEATGADYARTMRRLSMVPMRLEGEGQAVSADGDDASSFGGFLSAEFLDSLPAPLTLADAIAASLPPEANVRALAALARRDAAFSFALGVPAEMLERLAARHRQCAALRAAATGAGAGEGAGAGAGGAGGGDGGAGRKRAEDAARWSGWLARYSRRLALEARAAAALAAASAADAAVQRAATARREAMDGPGGNPAFVLREEELKEAVAAAERGGGGGDGGAALRLLLERARRPFS